MSNKKSIILGLIIIIITVIILTGCGFYNLVDSKEFKNHFSALGYTIKDTEESKYEVDSYIVAEKEDMPFKIEHYELKDEVEAKKVYEKLKDSIANYITSESKNTETKGSYFTKVVGVSDNEYVVVSRVKNTIIFVASTKEYTNEIDTLLEDIEY